jgi:trans-aconitate methyltransferase
MYTDFAAWWPVLSAPVDYEGEANFIRHALQLACRTGLVTVLELGSGGGNNASFLKSHFKMTLVDQAPGMLAVSRQLNPQCEHLQGDMRSLRLGRLFDAVLIHDAIMYMTSPEDLRQALQTAFIHCRPGGAALFMPDCTRETFSADTDHGGHDLPDGRAMRYLEWTYDPDETDDTYTIEFAYLLRSPDGGVQVAHDRHITGLFRRDQWLDWIEAAGFLPRALPDPYSREVFLGLKPVD